MPDAKLRIPGIGREGRRKRGRPRGSTELATALKRQSIMDEMVSIMESDPTTTQKQLAVHFGIDQAAVSRLYRQALEYMPIKTVEQHRELVLIENREATDRVLAVLRADHPYVSEGRIIHEVTGHDRENRPIYGEPLQDAKPVLQAATTLTALHNRLSSLIGADAPKRLETANVHVSATDLRVAPIIEQFRLSNSHRQDQIVSRVSSRRELPPGAPVNSQGAVRRPVGAWHHRRSGFGANPQRAEAWDPSYLFE